VARDHIFARREWTLINRGKRHMWLVYIIIALFVCSCISSAKGGFRREVRFRPSHFGEDGRQLFVAQSVTDSMPDDVLKQNFVAGPELIFLPGPGKR